MGARRRTSARVYYIWHASGRIIKNHELFRIALQSVADLPVRAVFSTGAEMDRSLLGAVPGNVKVEAWVPQAEIFPRAAILLCHGGAGTVIAALANGLPMVLTPINADQPENARRVAAIGAGIALPNANATSLPIAIETALSDARIRAAAGRAAREIREMASVDDAVSKIELMKTGCSMEI